jgi:hypothetical protein
VSTNGSGFGVSIEGLSEREPQASESSTREPRVLELSTPLFAAFATIYRNQRNYFHPDTRSAHEITQMSDLGESESHSYAYVTVPVPDGSCHRRPRFERSLSTFTS